MKLLHQDFEDQIAELAAEAEEIKVMIAFLTEGGLNWLPDDKWDRSEFIVGIDLGISTPGALKSLQEGGERECGSLTSRGGCFTPRRST